MAAISKLLKTKNISNLTISLTRSYYFSFPLLYQFPTISEFPKSLAILAVSLFTFYQFPHFSLLYQFFIAIPTFLILTFHSSRITEPKSQCASQAVLYGVVRGQAGSWSLLSVVRGQHLQHALPQPLRAVEEGSAAGMVPFRFNIVGVSDAISMGTRGMCYM